MRVAERDEPRARQRDDRVGALEARHRGATASGSRLPCRAAIIAAMISVSVSREVDAAFSSSSRRAPAFVRLPLWPRATVPRVRGEGSRLRVRPVHAPGRRVARVADRDLAGERRELLLVEDLGDEAHVAQHGQPCPASETAMPAHSWPRCCSAKRAKYVSRATSRSAERMPKTPHSSWGRSSSMSAGRGAVAHARASGRPRS